MQCNAPGRNNFSLATKPNDLYVSTSWSGAYHFQQVLLWGHRTPRRQGNPTHPSQSTISRTTLTASSPPAPLKQCTFLIIFSHGTAVSKGRSWHAAEAVPAAGWPWHPSEQRRGYPYGTDSFQVQKGSVPAADFAEAAVCWGGRQQAGKQGRVSSVPAREGERDSSWMKNEAFQGLRDTWAIAPG